MPIYEMLLVAVGLAADAFAVSIAVGSFGVANDHRASFRLAFHLGLFQFLMPVLGWHLGAGVERYIADLDHWVAFILLAFIGVKMIREALSKMDPTMASDPTKGTTLVVISLATSIDALVVGFSLALLRIDVWQPGIIIGLVTASMSFAGIRLGRRLHRGFGTIVAVIGGVILILIGMRIVYDHLIR